MQQFIDAHAHMDKFEDPEATVSAAKAAGCIAIVASGYNHDANVKSVLLASKFSNYIFPVIGIAPSVAMDMGEKEFAEAFKYVEEHAHKCVAIGEIGLDFHWPTKTEQIEREHRAFDMQLELALSKKLPVVIHSRKAESETVERLISAKAEKVLLHFFSGTPETAIKAADAGFYFTTPPVKSSTRMKMLAAIPLERILLESDSPYVAKAPADAVGAASLVAKAKGISIEEAIKSTTENARRFFGLKL